MPRKNIPITHHRVSYTYSYSYLYNHSYNRYIRTYGGWNHMVAIYTSYYMYVFARISPVLRPQVWPCYLRSRIPRCPTYQCLPPTPPDDSLSWRPGWSMEKPGKRLMPFGYTIARKNGLSSLHVFTTWSDLYLDCLDIIPDGFPQLLIWTCLKYLGMLSTWLNLNHTQKKGFWHGAYHFCNQGSPQYGIDNWAICEDFMSKFDTWRVWVRHKVRERIAWIMTQDLMEIGFMAKDVFFCVIYHHNYISTVANQFKSMSILGNTVLHCTVLYSSYWPYLSHASYSSCSSYSSSPSLRKCTPTDQDIMNTSWNGGVAGK